MNLKLDYNLQKLIRGNLLPTVTLVVLTAFLVISIVFFIGLYQENTVKINSLQSELTELNKKKELIDFKNQVIENVVDLDHINAVFSQLIPNEEDYFSIITSLEKLSIQTNFIITSYTINLAGSAPGKLAIGIDGQGDPNTFLEFLKVYNFGGSRLLTIDKIEFSQEAFTGSRISINVYSGKGEGAQALTKLSAEDRKLIQKIALKVQLELKSEEAAIDYPTKSNPF